MVKKITLEESKNIVRQLKNFMDNVLKNNLALNNRDEPLIARRKAFNTLTIKQASKKYRLDIGKDNEAGSIFKLGSDEHAEFVSVLMALSYDIENRGLTYSYKSAYERLNALLISNIPLQIKDLFAIKAIKPLKSKENYPDSILFAYNRNGSWFPLGVFPIERDKNGTQNYLIIDGLSREYFLSTGFPTRFFKRDLSGMFKDDKILMKNKLSVHIAEIMFDDTSKENILQYPITRAIKCFENII